MANKKETAEGEEAKQQQQYELGPIQKVSEFGFFPKSPEPHVEMRSSPSSSAGLTAEFHENTHSSPPSVFGLDLAAQRADQPLGRGVEKKGSRSTEVTESTTRANEGDRDGQEEPITWSEEEERKLVRKLDWCLLPTVWLMTLISWMDHSRYYDPPSVICRLNHTNHMEVSETQKLRVWAPT